MHTLDFEVAARNKIYEQLKRHMIPMKRTHNGRDVDIFVILQEYLMKKNPSTQKDSYTSVVNELQLNYDPFNDWGFRLYSFPSDLYNWGVREDQEQDYNLAINGINLKILTWILIYEYSAKPTDFAVILAQNNPAKKMVTEITIFKNGFWGLNQVKFSKFDLSRQQHKTL